MGTVWCFPCILFKALAHEWEANTAFFCPGYIPMPATIRLAQITFPRLVINYTVDVPVSNPAFLQHDQLPTC